MRTTRRLEFLFALISRFPFLHGLIARITGCDDAPIPYVVTK